MTRLAAGLAVMLPILAVLPGTARGETVFVFDWTEMSPIVGEILGSGRSGGMVRRDLGGGIVVNITPQKGVSRATGRVCDGCTDPCRSYELDVEADGGDVVHQYEGQACAASGNYRNWTGDEPRLLRTLRIKPPGPDPAQASAARALLSELGYEGAGTSDDALAAALDDFRRDAGVGVPGSMLDAADLAALRETRRRSQGDRSACRANADGPFSACGTTAD